MKKLLAGLKPAELRSLAAEHLLDSAAPYSADEYFSKNFYGKESFNDALKLLGIDFEALLKAETVPVTQPPRPTSKGASIRAGAKKTKAKKR